MKPNLDIKWQNLPNYKEENLIQRICRSSREHGYHSAVIFGIVRLKDHVLQQWAMRAAWNKIRVKYQRWRGVTIGEHVHWGTNVIVDGPFPYFVIVEDGASLAGNNLILTHTKPTKYFNEIVESYVAPVIIHKNAWICANVTILPGCEIGEGAIVSAGSVVVKDIPPMTVASGNPAKVVSDISSFLKSNYEGPDFERILSKRKAKYRI